MAATLSIENFPPLNLRGKTYLSADAAAEDDSVTVKSDDGIASNLLALIGTIGQQNTELRRISGVSGGVLELTAELVRPHREFDDVTILYGDKINIYYAPNVSGQAPPDTDFSLLNSIDIAFNGTQTKYVHGPGGSGYWYKFTYYNSLTTSESALEDSIAQRGGAGDSYATINGIRKLAGFENNIYMTDTYIADFRAKAQNWLDSKLKGTFTVPFTAPVPPKITEITELYAAGRLLLKEYGDAATGTNKDGNEKIKEAKELVEELRKGTSDLVGSDGSSLTTGKSVGGWPNRDTATAEPEDGGAPRSFRVNKVW